VYRCAWKEAKALPSEAKASFQNIDLSRVSQATPPRCGWLGGDVVDHRVEPRLVDDAAADALSTHRERIPVGVMPSSMHGAHGGVRHNPLSPIAHVHDRRRTAKLCRWTNRARGFDFADDNFSAPAARPRAQGNFAQMGKRDRPWKRLARDLFGLRSRPMRRFSLKRCATVDQLSFMPTAIPTL